MTELYEKIFNESFEGILRALQDRLEKSDFSIENVKAELNSFYKYEGLDWDGRGDIKQADIEGSIAAFEVFIAKYESGEYAS
jgi:hypothetical protein